MFSDESWFQLENGKRWLWRKRDDFSPAVCTDKMAHPPKVMIWGAIGKNFKSKLIFLDGPVTSETYIFDVIVGSNVLNEADSVYGPGGWLLQQDNAKPHVAKDTHLLLTFFGAKILSDWPPYSPDLNIIETIWAIMKKRLEASPVKTIEELKRVIQEIWDNLSFETINRLVDSIPKRLRACINNMGNTVLKY